MNDLVLYLSAFSLSALGTNFQKKTNNYKLLRYIIILFFPVCLATFRIGVGTDYQSYLWGYNSIVGGVATPYEPLFTYLNKLAFHTFGDFSGLLFLSAIITYGCVLLTAERHKSDISVGIAMWVFFCFYYSASLNVMRQLIAVGIVFFASSFLSEKRYKCFAGLTIIATLFHTSALIAFTFVLIKIASKKNCNLTVLITVTVSFFLMFFSNTLVNLFSNFLDTKYNEYIKHDTYLGLSYILDIIPTFLIVGVPAIYYLMFCHRDSQYDFYCCLSTFCLPMLVLGANFDFFQRIVYYFDISQVIMVPLILQKTESKTAKTILKVLYVTFYAFYFWYSSIYRMSNEIIPYRYNFF